MSRKLMTAGNLSFGGSSLSSELSKRKLYSAEQDAIKEDFASLNGGVLNWGEGAAKKKISEFAANVIHNTSIFINENDDLVSMVLPTEKINPGESLILRELHGVNVYYSSYGAAVRMSRPQFTNYTITTTPKEVGLDLELTQIQVGKYSPSELAEYTGKVIQAWRNYLLFTTTISGMAIYSSGGAQYVSGATLSATDMNKAIGTITDEGDVGLIVGRRKAIQALASQNAGMAWSDASKDEFKNTGQVGSYAGIPVKQVYSFTDPDYGSVNPCLDNQLFIFSSLPAGRLAVENTLRTSEETIKKNERLNIYFRFGDGIGLSHTNRIAVVGAITPY